MWTHRANDPEAKPGDGHARPRLASWSSSSCAFFEKTVHGGCFRPTCHPGRPSPSCTDCSARAYGAGYTRCSSWRPASDLGARRAQPLQSLTASRSKPPLRKDDRRATIQIKEGVSVTFQPVRMDDCSPSDCTELTSRTETVPAVE